MSQTDLPLAGIHLFPLILRLSKDERTTGAANTRGSGPVAGETSA